MNKIEQILIDIYNEGYKDGERFGNKSGNRKPSVDYAFNKIKKLGLFTLDDIEIAEDEIIKIIKKTGNIKHVPMSGDLVVTYLHPLAKAIADKKPIKIKK